MPTPALLGIADVSGTLSTVPEPIGYALVFVLAAIPWFEILLVVPPAIALGLDPVLVAVLAFSGNVLPIYGIVAFYDRVSRWFEARRDGEGSTQPKRYQRGRRVWDRYGIAGLALVAPVLTGVHLAAVIALGLRTPGRTVAAWMTASIALWTVVLVVSSIAGVSVLAN